MGTFGKTDIGGEPPSIGVGYKIGTNYQMAAVAGQRLKSIHIYCSAVGDDIKVAIYAVPGNTQTSDPGALIWGSAAFTPSVGWNEIVIPEGDRPALTASQWYNLAWREAGSATFFNYDTGAADSEKYTALVWADPWSDPFGTPTDRNLQWSIYGEYEAIPVVAGRSFGFIMG